MPVLSKRKILPIHERTWDYGYAEKSEGGALQMPYHSYVRGANENTNGFICQFLPKFIALDGASDELTYAVEDNWATKF